jgi:hypothetical protein
MRPLHSLPAIAFLLTACDGRPSPDPTHQAREAVRIPAARPPPAIPVPAPVVPPPAHDETLDFRSLTDTIASRTGSRVIAWGTALLADDGSPRAFAVLEPEDGGPGRGAYLIEDTEAARWLVSFAADGRTLPWALEPGTSRDSDPAWQVRSDGAVEHAQSHPHGGEELAFALRGGDLVVLEHDYTGDADTEVTERQRFATDGVCDRPCPLLREFTTEDLDLVVTGPSAALSSLIAERSSPTRADRE